VAYLVDTNVLLRLSAPADPRHAPARRAVELLEGSGLFVSGQNFIEFWSVTTRPLANNGLGKTPAVARKLLDWLEQAFPLLPESAEVYDRWRELVTRFGVSGVKVHDTRLVAVMLANNISEILTFNTEDFERYRELGIRATDPLVL